MSNQAFSNTNLPKNFELSGPEALRAFFFPRQIIQIQEAARILGIGREALYKRIWRGDHSLKIRKFPGGRQYVLLDDLISYLLGSETTPSQNLESPSSANYTNGVTDEPKKKRGRPRGSKNNGRKG